MSRAEGGGNILVISHDVVGSKMAGPGIRYECLARVLAQEFQVTLAVPAESALESSQDLLVLAYHSGEDAVLAEAVRQAGVVIIPAVWLAGIPSLLQPPVPLVIDGYDPFLAETLFLQGDGGDALLGALSRAYLVGDFFICASERQRGWWLGLLEAHGRINRYTFAEDPSLRRLVDTVPFGLPETPPQHTRPIVKGVWPGIDSQDHVILWGGGLWPWLDPLTAVRAIAQVWRQRHDVRLVFPGTRHPNPQMASIPTHYEAAFRAAEQLGVLNRAVFFGDWVPYADWPDVLLESDVALALHHDSLETHLAFRSRVLDYIWAELPIVATRGDATSELVASYGIGAVVEYEDVDGVTEAILRLLEAPRESLRERFERARQELTWERAARPLVKFCRHPRRAPDKVALGEAIGNPFYLEQLAFWKRESERLEAQADAYERGRFMRFMRWVHQAKGKFLRKAPQ